MGMNKKAHDERDRELGGMRNVWIITLAMMTLAICYTMLVPFLPVYLLELGVDKDLLLSLSLVLWPLYGEKLPISTARR